MLTESRILHVWHECYHRKSAFLTAEEVDLQAEWDDATQYFAEHMVTCLLARETEEGIFEIFGIDERIQYLIEKEEAQAERQAEKGRESARRRREKYGTAQPNRWGNSEPNPNRLPNTGSEKSEPSEPLSSFSSSFSSSSSNTRDERAAANDLTSSPDGDSSPQGQLFPVEVVGKKPRRITRTENNAVPFFIQAYVDAWRVRYPGERKPDLGGKVRGRIKTFLADVSVDEAIDLIQVYLQLDDPWFKTKCHDFETFMQNVTKVSAALGAGKQNPGKKDWYELFLEQEKEREERRRKLNGQESI